MSEGARTESGGGSAERLTMVGLVAGAAGLAGLGPRLRRRLTPAVGPTVADVLSTSVLTGLGWLMVAVVERRRPYRPDWQIGVDQESAVDLAFAVVMAPPAAMVATLLSDRLDGASSSRLGPSRPSWPTGLPLPARVACAIGATELVHYWHHRLSHERSWLWRFHSVHHTPDRLNWLNSGRFHPVDLVPLLTLQLAVVRLLGVDDDAFTAMQIFKGIHGQIQHSNVAGGTGALDAVFSTAEQHRLHHAATRAAGSCNYGAVLSTFDRIFGTKVLLRGEEVGELGLGGGPSRRPVTFTEHLSGPLRSGRARAGLVERATAPAVGPAGPAGPAAGFDAPGLAVAAASGSRD